jgi:hypothetical protein
LGWPERETSIQRWGRAAMEKDASLAEGHRRFRRERDQYSGRIPDAGARSALRAR